jgi:hypothetical protein
MYFGGIKLGKLNSIPNILSPTYLALFSSSDMPIIQVPFPSVEVVYDETLSPKY